MAIAGVSPEAGVTGVQPTYGLRGVLGTSLASPGARPAGPIGSVLRHWTTIANTALVLFAALPVAEPLLRALGWSALADAIFGAYGWVCHQFPSRSWFVAGQPLAWCERNTAIYTTMAACGLLWPHLRRRLPQLSPVGFALLCLPMAIDGFTQLVALRESTWELRTVTGALFGAACIWFGYPLLARTARFFRLLRLLRLPSPALAVRA